jgi:hypothetical protein
MRQMATATIFGFANHPALLAEFIFYKKWPQKEKYPNNTRLPGSRLPDNDWIVSPQS